jgi:hypothetical protein
MKVRTVNGLVFLVLAVCLAMALLYGCATVGVRGERADLPGLREATVEGWNALECIGPPPTVLVVQGSGLSCTDPNSGNPGFPVQLSTGPSCREGYTLSPFQVSVAYRGQPWSETPLVHEELHACQARIGVVEPGHHGFTGPDWGPGGRMDRGNVRLRERGL